MSNQPARPTDQYERMGRIALVMLLPGAIMGFN